MNITVNGQPREVQEGTTVHALVGAPQGIAVALNGAVLPSGSWESTALSDSDALEIVSAHQGG